MRLERSKEIEQCLVGISFEKVGKLLHLYSSYLSELRWLLENLGNEIHHSRGSSLILLHILVEDRRESHNLLLSESCLFAYTSKASSEINEISCRRRRRLRQLVDCRTCCKHRTIETFGLILPEELSELAYVLYCIITKIITKGNVNLVGCINKLLYGLVSSNTETTSISCKRVEFFACGASVHTLEFFVHSLYLFFGLTSVLHNIGHRLVHRSKV